ncbi:MAG: DUF4129 domain-containing protein [Candidatus Thiodiazotropha sp. 6PLUC9]
MDLNKIAIRLRPRSSWEGMDLGFAMAREWFLNLWLLWLCSALPVMLLLTLLPLPLWLAGVIMWWLKPAYEPPLLFWMSRRVFSEEVTLSAVFKEWTRIVLPQLFASLTWRRLTLSRSFFMPVVVLEGLKGARRTKRISVLGKTSNVSVWLTSVGLHFEVILQFGLLGLILALIPEDLLWVDWQSYLFKPDPVSEWLHHLSALAAMSLIAPFYVAAGFGLYLTRRSQLEAWDLELGLRQLAQRHPPRPGVAGKVVVACLALLFSGMAPLDSSQAMEISRAESQSLIEEVLKDEAFGQERERHYWKYIGDDEDSPEESDSAFLQWLEDIAEHIAALGEFLLWILVAGVLAFLVYWYFQNRGMLGISGFGKQKRGEPPRVVAGLDLRPESLPDDPASTSARLIEQDKIRDGLGLLYRATLSQLVHAYALPIHEGATEGECLNQSQTLAQPGISNYFAELTAAWQQLAYAHHRPEKAHLLELCRSWGNHFEVDHAG